MNDFSLLLAFLPYSARIAYETAAVKREKPEKQGESI